MDLTIVWDRYHCDSIRDEFDTYDYNSSLYEGKYQMSPAEEVAGDKPDTGISILGSWDGFKDAVEMTPGGSSRIKTAVFKCLNMGVLFVSLQPDPFWVPFGVLFGFPIQDFERKQSTDQSIRHFERPSGEDDDSWSCLVKLGETRYERFQFRLSTQFDAVIHPYVNLFC